MDRKGEARELQRFRKWLDTAFYLLGWANFEHLTRRQAEVVALEGARSKGRDSHAWMHLKESLKYYAVKKRLELIFHGKPRVIGALKHQYDVRNDAAHDYKKLPPEVSDLPSLLQEWEDLASMF